ncbi:MAG: 4Fe-4S dicluster domain-containing protein [Syntrophobacterales bacterium]|nr:4Fe-4S dicluster domain-containing protein [Syntrophobacterales bacterium]
MESLTTEGLTPSTALPARLAAQFSVSPSVCYQCKKCSAGCPLTFAMDLLPDTVIRLALLGQEEALLRCRTIWVCASCVTCTTRCPNGIDIAGVMDWLKEEAVRRGVAVPQPEVATFHRYFLDSIRRGGGRLSETALMQRYTLFQLRRRPNLAELVRQLKLGWELFRRRRLRLWGPPALKGRQDIRAIFEKAGA